MPIPKTRRHPAPAASRRSRDPYEGLSPSDLDRSRAAARAEFQSLIRWFGRVVGQAAAASTPGERIAAAYEAYRASRAGEASVARYLRLRAHVHGGPVPVATRREVRDAVRALDRAAAAEAR